ncbi:universal stress protein [Haladaptatus sp. NG-WS-4]
MTGVDAANVMRPRIDRYQIYMGAWIGFLFLCDRAYIVTQIDISLEGFTCSTEYSFQLMVVRQLCQLLRRPLNIAETYDATLHVLYVVEPPSVASDGDRFAGLDNLIEKLEQNGHHVIEAVAARAKESNIEATTAVRRGIPRDEILTYAPEHDIDLIVLRVS